MKSEYFGKIDKLILIPAGFSFLMAIGLWVIGSVLDAIFVAIWVPSLLIFGLYFKYVTSEKIKKINHKPLNKK